MHEDRLRIRTRACIALLIAGAVFAIARSGILERGPVICPLRSTTGVPCGSCGLTRGLSAVSRGDILAAGRLNLASVPLSAVALGALGLLTFEALTGRPALARIWSRCAGPIIWIGVAIVALQWIANLANLRL